MNRNKDNTHIYIYIYKLNYKYYIILILSYDIVSHSNKHISINIYETDETDRRNG